MQSDVTKLVPTSMPALRNLNTLEKVTGVSGEIDVTVRSKNVATPATVQWMISYERQLLAHFGYLEEKGCGAATLCPALSLPDLFSSASQSASSTSASLTQAQITAFLAAVPSYFSQAVITPDHREATLAFGIRLMPLSRQEQVIDYMRAHLNPPAGTTAALAGLPVLAAEANASLSSTWHRFLTLIAGLLAVALVLLAVLRTVTARSCRWPRSSWPRAGRRSSCSSSGSRSTRCRPRWGRSSSPSPPSSASCSPSATARSARPGTTCTRRSAGPTAPPARRSWPPG